MILSSKLFAAADLSRYLAQYAALALVIESSWILSEKSQEDIDGEQLK
jgi:hypothetical protein